MNSRTNDPFGRLRRACIPTHRLMMSSATTIVGVGTTGSESMIALHGLVHRATFGQLPKVTRWVSLDADKDSRDAMSLAHQTTIEFLSVGLDGAGTVLGKGYAIGVKAFPEIANTILDAMSSLTAADDPRFPLNKAPSSCQTVVLISGIGGTSGGITDLVLTACLKASAHLGHDIFRVINVTIGGEIPWRDMNRSLNKDGIRRILANYAECSMWRYSQMATQRPITIEVPGHGRMRLPASTRISSNIELDWENPFVKLSTVEDVINMLSAALFHRLFTAVGTSRSSRECDDVTCGRTGQNHPLVSGATL